MRGLLLLLVLLAIAAAIALGLVFARRRRAAAQAGAAPSAPVDPLRRSSGVVDPRELKVGDVVNHEGSDYLIRGTLRFDQEGFQWQEHLIDDTTQRRWLSVEDDEELDIVLWQAVQASELQPGPSPLDYDGARWVLDEHGRARFTAEGSTGTAPQGAVEYYDYQAGERRLSFERFGSTGWEVGRGTPVAAESLDIYPRPAS